MKMTSHYPPSDPLMYLDPKWVQESKVQCNLCPKAFKSLVVLKQHIGRSHKSDCKAAGVKRFEQTDIEENKLIMTQAYTWEFQCPYQLQKYPFDNQVYMIQILRHVSTV